MNRVLIILFLLIGNIMNAVNQPLETVDHVDPGKYLGRWYDIASYPARFQKGCRCTTADYEQIHGKKYIRVTNRCIRFKKGRSEMNVVQGKAFAVKGSNNARLKVQFFWPFRGDYYIIGLADDYSWAVVGHPKRKYLWILSRESYMPTYTYNHILTLVKSKGYDLNRIQKTPQECDIEHLP
jgi:apolipoprotein D and lipocalin family protein